MPLIKIRNLLILDMVINFKTLNTSFLHKILNNRSNDFLIDLMNTEWKVPMYSLLAFLSPTMSAILSFISEAAFLVNVNARIRDGSHPFERIYAILLVKTLVFPDPAPATRRPGPSTQLTAAFCSLFSPSNIVLHTFSITGAKLYKTFQFIRTFCKKIQHIKKGKIYFVNKEKIRIFASAF